MNYTFFLKDISFEYLVAALLPKHKHYVETWVSNSLLISVKKLAPHNSINWSQDIDIERQQEIEEILEFGKVSNTKYDPHEFFETTLNLVDAVIVSDFSCMKEDKARKFVDAIFPRLCDTQSPALIVADSQIMQAHIENLPKNIQTALLIDPDSKRYFTLAANYDLSTTPAFNLGKTSVDRQSNARRAERWSEKLESLPKDLQILLLSALLSDKNEK